jgi:hypothetical protein
MTVIVRCLSVTLLRRGCIRRHVLTLVEPPIRRGPALIRLRTNGIKPLLRLITSFFPPINTRILICLARPIASRRSSTPPIDRIQRELICTRSLLLVERGPPRHVENRHDSVTVTPTVQCLPDKFILDPLPQHLRVVRDPAAR